MNQYKHIPTRLFFLVPFALLFFGGCYHVAALDEDTDSHEQDDTTGSNHPIIGYDSDSEPIYSTDNTDSDSLGSDTQPLPNFCLSLDGDEDFMRVFSGGEATVTNDWTTEAWVLFYRNEQWDSQPILRLGEGAATGVGSYFLYARYHASSNNNKPMGGYGYTANSFYDLYGIEPITEGEWTHIAFVHSYEKQQFFINGMLQEEQNHTDDAYELLTDNLIIGAIEHPSLTGYFEGCIDDIRISSIVRYVDEFTPQTNFQPDAYTVGLWTFNGEEEEIFIDDTLRLEAELVGDAEIVER